MKLLEEESLLVNPEGKPLSEKEKTLIQLALLCHEAANLTDNQHDIKEHAEIFRFEAEQLGFFPTEFEPIASALLNHGILNKGSNSPSGNIYHWLIHDPKCLEYLRFITHDLNSFRKEELNLYNHFVKTNNPKGITKLTTIIEKYKQFIVGFMASNRLPLQQYSNRYLATKAFLYQLAIHHAIPSAGNIVIFDPTAVALVNLDPICLFDAGPDFLRKVVEKCDSFPQKDEFARDLFKTEGLFLRVLGPVNASTRTHVEESVINSNREIIRSSKITNNPVLFWQGYQQNKLPGIKFRPATFIKDGFAIQPYQDNKSVSFLIRANNKAIKFYKGNAFSNLIPNGNFNFQRTQDGIKSLDRVEDLERKLRELNARRLGKLPDPYNRCYGCVAMGRNEVFLVNYDFKDVVGIHIGDIQNKTNLLEALYWYVRLTITNHEHAHLYYYCHVTGKLVSILIKELLEKYFNNVEFPSIKLHYQASFGGIHLQNPSYQTFTTAEIGRAKITMIKVLDSLETDKDSGGAETYNVELESGKKFTATLHPKGFPVIKIDGETKPTYDSKGLMRQTIRVYQEQTAHACQKLFLDSTSYFENKYAIATIEIKIVHHPKKYPNGEREKNYLYCNVIFLKKPQGDSEEVYCRNLEILLGVRFDTKAIEICLPERRIILRDRTPHKILEVFEKLKREIQVDIEEKESPSTCPNP